LTGNYGLVNDDNGERHTLSGLAQIGYFRWREHQFGLNLFGSWTHIDAIGGDTYFYTIGPFYDFNSWITPQTSIYLGPQAGISVFSGATPSETALAFGARIGVRHWISPSTALTFEPRYTFTDFDNSLGGDQDDFSILIGFSVVL